MTIWKPVRGFSPYEISNEGEVRNSTTGELKRENKRTNPRGKTEYKLGYRNISLSRLMRENHPYEWIKYLYDDEEVKPINGHPDFYITSRGRVWSMRWYRFLSISPVKNTYYHSVSLHPTRKQIHTLVGRHFLPEYREGLCILHRDENLSYPEINYPENLWVGTHQDNMDDMNRKNRRYRGNR